MNRLAFPLFAAFVGVLSGCASRSSQPTPTVSNTKILATAPILVSTSLSSGPFERLSSIQGEGKTAEIVIATSDGKTLLYNDATGGKVGFVSIENPVQPKPGGMLMVGGEPTSLAFTRDNRWVLVCTRPVKAQEKPQLVVFEFATRRIARRLILDGQPDCLKISPDGRYAVLAIENERADMKKPMPQAPAGFVAIVDLQGPPAAWKTRAISFLNLLVRFPTDPEPEFIAINSQNEAAISLQENNGVAILDLKSGRVVESWSCGTTEHAADLKNDGKISFSDTLRARREPDALAWTPAGHILTANEGDYDLDETEFRAGSRGASLFNRRGQILWDSGNLLDETAAKNASYKDKRSPKRGSEPEGVEIAIFAGKPYAFVGCERAAGIAVFDLSEETQPKLVQWLATGDNPEGLLAIPARNLLISANEGDNTLSIFGLR